MSVKNVDILYQVVQAAVLKVVVILERTSSITQSDREILHEQMRNLNGALLDER